MVVSCAHLDQIEVDHIPGHVDGCEDCLKIDGRWVHLRMCLACGHVGCCDDSPNRHARAHAAETMHVVITSLEPGEEWCWCFADEVGFLIDVPRG